MALTQITTNGIKDGTITGTDLATNIDLVDNQKLRLGTGNDLEIFHDGTNSRIRNVTGQLQLRSDSIALENNDGSNYAAITGLRLLDNAKARFGSSNDLLIYHDNNNSYILSDRFFINNLANSENIATFIADGGVSLYYDNSEKFETKSYGALVTGYITASPTSGNLGFHAGDDTKMTFGTGDDLQIFHNGTGSLIDNDTGNLLINTASGEVQINKSTSEYMARFICDGAVELYYDNSKKFETRSDGNKSTGVFYSDGDIRPWGNNTSDLGSTSNRWANIYTNDLNLSNEGGSNDVDGTYGSYTIQEGHHDLFLINKRTGKKYKFNLTEVK